MAVSPRRGAPPPLLRSHWCPMRRRLCELVFELNQTNNKKYKLWMCKMWDGNYMHVERERERERGDLWNRWALWIWGRERRSVNLRSAFAILFVVVVVADWVCAERVKGRERERERGGEGGSISEMVFSFYFLGRSIGGRNVRAGT